MLTLTAAYSPDSMPHSSGGGHGMVSWLIERTAMVTPVVKALDCARGPLGGSEMFVNTRPGVVFRTLMSA
jgi:hypothetical protein